MLAFLTLPRVPHLKEKYPFPREDRMAFRDHYHKCFVDGVHFSRSVTSLLHEYATTFDPSRALASMKRGRDGEARREAMEQQGLGASDEEIQERWGRNGELQSKRGQLLNHHAELLLNGIEAEEPHSPEFKQVKAVDHARLLRGLTPHRAELCISHGGLRVAGQINALFFDRD